MFPLKITRDSCQFMDRCVLVFWREVITSVFLDKRQAITWSFATNYENLFTKFIHHTFCRHKGILLCCCCCCCSSSSCSCCCCSSSSPPPPPFLLVVVVVVVVVLLLLMQFFIFVTYGFALVAGDRHQMHKMYWYYPTFRVFINFIFLRYLPSLFLLSFRRFFCVLAFVLDFK